jgi:hypothetical protein
VLDLVDIANEVERDLGLGCVGKGIEQLAAGARETAKGTTTPTTTTDRSD